MAGLRLRQRGHRLFHVVPLPCVHELAGQGVHQSWSEWNRCLDENGVPGFRLEEVRL